ncbi:MAG: nicotinate-nucleotide diphosphorylase (carboxylating), partial [Solirubrobacterales bacterium]|nr:nicotinate-nucleotide diphosphorylase (carboxylating) [Solirubrobacterales bacterium]
MQTTISDIVARALAEDLGDRDVTSEATVPEGARARAEITQKAPGVVFGLEPAEETFRALDRDVVVGRLTEEGVWRNGGLVLSAEGSARAILSAERTALNFLQRLSGVATMTARCVRAVEGTGAK